MSIIKQALYSSGSSIFIWSYTRHSVCCVWALMHLKQCEVNEDWRSCPVSLWVFLTVAFTVITTIIALISRCAAQAWPLSGRCKMMLCSIYNSVQSRPSQMNMLVYHRPCTTSVITAANLSSAFAKANHCGLFFLSDFTPTPLSCPTVTMPQTKAVCPPTELSRVLCVSAGKQWWDDNHVQHDLQGLPGGGRTGTHLWGFQQGHTLLQDPDGQTLCLLWVSLSLFCKTAACILED